MGVLTKMVRSNVVSRYILALFFCAGLLVSPWGAEPIVAEELKPDDGLSSDVLVQPVSLEASEATAIEEVELPVAETKVETHKSLSATVGYRFVSVDGYGGRAAEYSDLRSGPNFSVLNSVLGRDHKFVLEGDFTTDNTYNANLSYDYKGAYRFKFMADSFYHNLDRLPVPSTLPFGYAPDERDRGESYGIRSEQDLASLRARMGTYPIHLNLHYWRMLKDGDRQLMFADQGFFPATATNSLNSKRRRIDSETHEGKFGFDAHLGPIDLIYDFTVRQYHDHAGTPRNDFVDRTTGVDPDFYRRSGGNYEHSENPESSYLAHNFKAHTEQTGGIVAAAAYSIAQRKNRSELTQVSGANGLTDTLQTAAGDFVYTPCKEFSLAVRFRHQETDRDSAIVTTSGFLPATITANSGLDTRKDIVSAILSLRPIDPLTIKGEYRGESIHRDNTDSWDPLANNVSGASLPMNSESHKGILTVLGRPYKNLRLKTRYSYTTVTNPEYGLSYDKRHEGQILATYSLKERFGVTANYQISHDDNDSSAINRLNSAGSVPVNREKKQVSGTAAAWGTLLDGRVSLTGTIGLLRSNADQETLFSAIAPTGSATASNFTSQAFLYGITVSVRPAEKLDASVAFQQIRSSAEFDPVNAPYTIGALPGDMIGVKEITWTKTVENSVSFRADYELSKSVSCGLDYRFREYNDDRSSLFDGSAHSVITRLTAKW